MNGCRYMNDGSFCIAKMGLIFTVIGWHFFGVMHLIKCLLKIHPSDSSSFARNRQENIHC